MKNFFLRSFLVFFIFLFVACTPKTTGIKIEISPQPYPMASTSIEENSYPPQIQTYESNAYPPTSSTSTNQSAPSFNIDEPLISGSMKISGSGPKNVPIILIDISDMGKVLAEININNHGKFSADLIEPLINKHSIGIIIGNLSGTNFSYGDFVYSDEYFDIPLIGIVFDKVIVIE